MDETEANKARRDKRAAKKQKKKEEKLARLAKWEEQKEKAVVEKTKLRHLIASFNEAWSTEGLKNPDLSAENLSDDYTCRDYLRVELTKKILHARSGDLLKRYTEIFKSQVPTLLDFRTALKATAAPGAPTKKAGGIAAERTTGGGGDEHESDDRL